jgi:hypothetical protein
LLRSASIPPPALGPCADRPDGNAPRFACWRRHELSFAGPHPYISKIFQGGGDDIVIARRAGPAFNKKRHRQIRDAVAAQEAGQARARERKAAADQDAAIKAAAKVAERLRLMRAAQDRVAAARLGALVLENATRAFEDVLRHSAVLTSAA